MSSASGKYATLALLVLVGFNRMVAVAAEEAAVTAVGPAAAANEWRVTGGDPSGSYHSPLMDINPATVSRLGFAWDLPLKTYRGQEATPLVSAGILYAVGNFGRVYAVDGATGKQLWTYDPGVEGQYGRYACCDVVNRGIALRNGTVYVESLDGYLHAIDAADGRRLWKIDTLPARGAQSPYTSTGGPVLAGDLVVIGSGGGDFKGVRGYVAAFDAATGALRWRFYTVPRNPALGPQDRADLKHALMTWDPRHTWETGGGGAVWDGIAYDAALDLVYVGTGNASPYDIKADGRRGGDDLYTDCILALHARSGTLAWHYQVVPGDMWDFDSTQKFILADLDVGGETHPVLMQASKNAFFYVLDRRDGKFLSAQSFAFQNWAKRIDPRSGRPTLEATDDYHKSPKLIFPWEGGAHSWQPMSFDAARRTVFIPVQETPNVIVDTEHRKAGLVEGQFTTSAFSPDAYDPAQLEPLFGPLPSLDSLSKGLPAPRRSGYLRAWDPVAQRLRWEVPTATGWDGGVLSTTSGLVFQGDETGALNVYAADSGALLKSIALGTTIMAAPMSYRINGVQYIALIAGYGGSDLAVPFPEKSAAFRYGNESRIIALRLDGPPPPLPVAVVRQPLPEPPPATGTAAQIDSGALLYNRYCVRCHAFGPAVLPDLRRLTSEQHALFSTIVRGGVLASLGMGRFDDVLSASDVEAVHAYVIDQAWVGFREQSATH